MTIIVNDKPIYNCRPVFECPPSYDVLTDGSRFYFYLYDGTQQAYLLNESTESAAIEEGIKMWDVFHEED